MLPKDNVMLLSFVNMKLRDFYTSLDDLCKDYGVTASEIKNRLKSIDYEYDVKINQFI